MFTRVQTVLTQKLHILPDRPILIGVSGGADSLTLMDILGKLDYPLIVAHFNHLLRPEASHDARNVELLAAKRGLPFTLGEGSAKDYAQEHHLSIEEAARELRYRFLFEQAQLYGAQAVAVAHNADDQVETVLMHLLRGAGLDGLTGMPYRALPNPWSDSIPLVRPLLGVWRAEIETYCAENSLVPVVDATNADTTYFRNRLRHNLIPELETYVPGTRVRLVQTADLLTADRQVLEEFTEQSWQAVLAEMDESYIVFRLPAFRLPPLGLQRRLIRKALAHLRPGARDADFSLVQRALDFAASPATTGQADLGLGLRIALEGENLLIADWGAELPNTHCPQLKADCLLPIPGTVNLGNGWVLKAEIPADVEAAQRAAAGNRDPFRAWVDLGERPPLLNVRPRYPGDRFQPLGMAGQSLKISDFMINQKIFQRARAAWPLVCAGDEIVWLPGFRLAHPFRVTEQSRQIVRLSLLQTA